LKSYPNVAALLAKPNPDQEWSEFIIQSEIYRQIYGHLYFYASTPEGLGTSDAYRLWVLSPDEVTINRDDTVTVTLDEQAITVPAQRVCEIKDSGRFTSPIVGARQNKMLFEHKSRVFSARYAIKNIIQAEEAIYSINRDRGALGLLSIEDKDASGRVPLHPVERDNILRQIRGGYGIGEGKSKIYVTNAAMKWQQMSMSVKELMLLEGMDKNMETLCNVFDYPKDLLVSDSKYSNKQVAKGHYEEAVIPFSQIYASKLGRFLGLAPGDNFVIDFSHVPAMKEAEEQKAKTYYQKATAVVKLYEDGVLSREEVRLEMGYEQEIDGKTMFNDKNQSNGGTDSGAN
jgi:phage portal protein BeeE